MATEILFPADLSKLTINVPVGTKKTLGPVEVKPFAQIRVVAFNGSGSPTSIEVLLVFAEGSGSSELLIGPLDTLILPPGSNQTKVYDVPGRFLAITVSAAAGIAGQQDTLGLVIYGN